MTGYVKNTLFLVLFALSISVLPARATVVEVQTVLGNFQVNLFDSHTPKTVENFLGYVNSGAYYNNVVHRSAPDFVIQAGGFTYNDDFPLDPVSKGQPVINEPELSNVRGTLAMAKTAGNPDSATSEWFINLADNSANLDIQNGGFTVFGQVLGDGMDIVDAIAQLQTYNAGGAFTEIPLRDYAGAQETISEENLVLITDVVVIDANTDTHPELQPVVNTLIDTVADNNDADSGGSIGNALWWLLALTILRVSPVALRYHRTRA
ncbi:peptidylprolyl isomerase [Lacimicrobium sp. SS2-24]|uniref:peptidylprolyl isomerase n=1 Tax=Lacimicrobium sp. SS2-24 TaxID=2005569 RepID=UPI000B4A9FC7|nr:peptidylprolyl isomerase [Lacimicrobium sp. SS2-24]